MESSRGFWGNEATPDINYRLHAGLEKTLVSPIKRPSVKENTSPVGFRGRSDLGDVVDLID